MARRKYKAGPAAQRIITNLTRSLAPEHRKHVHEGIRAATKLHIEDALEEAFAAGRTEGCTFER